MSTAPALYTATVTHQRRSPLVNRFRYRSFYWLIDIDDPPRLPRLFRSFADFRDSDHLDIRGVLAKNGLHADRVLRLAHARSPFSATLTGQRTSATLRSLLALWARHPLTPLRTSLLIRWRGIRLWQRGLPVQPR